MTIRFTVLERNVIFEFHILGEKNKSDIFMKIVAKYQIGKDRFELALEKIEYPRYQQEGNSLFGVLFIKNENIYYLNIRNVEKF